MNTLLTSRKFRTVWYGWLSLALALIMVSGICLFVFSKEKDALFLCKRARHELQNAHFLKRHEVDIKNIEVVISKKGLKAPFLTEGSFKKKISEISEIKLLDFKKIEDGVFDIKLEAVSDEPIYEALEQLLTKSPLGYFKLENVLITQTKNVHAILRIRQLSFVK